MNFSSISGILTTSEDYSTVNKTFIAHSMKGCMYNSCMKIHAQWKPAILCSFLLLSALSLGCQQPNDPIEPSEGHTPYHAPIPKAATFDGNLTVTIPKSSPLNDFTYENLAQNSIGPGMIFSRILKLTTNPAQETPHMKVECDLCEYWEYLPNNKIRFKIKDNIYWHNGDKLVPNHIRDHYKQHIIQDSKHYSLSAIESINTPENQILELNLNSLDSDLMFKLAHTENKVFHPELVPSKSNPSNSSQNITGTGPWMHVPQDNNTPDSITLVRNPVYFSHKKPLSQSITIKNIENLTYRKISALTNTGQSDIILNNTGVSINPNNINFVSTQSILSYGGPTLFFNLSKESMQPLLKRKKIFLLLDPWQHNSKSDVAPATIGIGIPIVTKNYSDNQKELRKRHFDDPVSTNQASDKITNATLLKIGVADSPVPYQLVLENILQDLQSSEYSIQTQSLSKDTYMQELSNKTSDFDILLGLTPPSEFINTFLFSTIHSKGEYSFSNSSDTTLDSMIEKQATEPNNLLRASQIRDIQEHVLEQAYMYNSASLRFEWIHHESVRNFFPNDNLGEYLYWSEIWVE